MGARTHGLVMIGQAHAISASTGAERSPFDQRLTSTAAVDGRHLKLEWHRAEATVERSLRSGRPDNGRHRPGRSAPDSVGHPADDVMKAHELAHRAHQLDRGGQVGAAVAGVAPPDVKAEGIERYAERRGAVVRRRPERTAGGASSPTAPSEGAEARARMLALAVSGPQPLAGKGAPAGERTRRAISEAGAGEQLSPDIQARVGAATGADLSALRIHTGREATLAAGEMGARAFSLGSDIFVGVDGGERDAGLMAHEASHALDYLGGEPTRIHLDAIDDIVDGYKDYGGLNLREEALGGHLAVRIRNNDLRTASQVLQRLLADDRRQVASATVAALSGSERASLGQNAEGSAFHGAISDRMISANTSWGDLDETALANVIAGHVRSNRFDLARRVINHLPSGKRDDVAKALYDELLSTEIRALANSTAGADLGHTMADVMQGGIETGAETNAIETIARGLGERDAEIPINSLIALFRQLERQFPDDSAQQLLTRVRQQSYPGGDYVPVAFDRLIPDAPIHESVESRDAWGNTTTTQRRRTLASMPDRSNRQYSYGLMTAHADENATGDNPSPYVRLNDGQRVDLGHLLLSIDALQHPRTISPYATYGMSNIDPASWVADIGIAAVWHDTHVDEGAPMGGVPDNAPSSPNFEQYYRMSAPDEDLFGDVDSFGIDAAMIATPGGKLSDILAAYYTGSSGAGGAGVTARWRTFCAANNFGYTRIGNTITWDPELQATLIPRVNDFNDMFAAGMFHAIGSTTIGTTGPRREWPSTPAAVDKFLGQVKRWLEAELAASSP